MDWILRQARLADDQPLVDLALHNGRIAAIAATITTQTAQEWDLAGRVVIPGLVDAHTHLDKSYVPTHNQSGTLLEAIAVWRQYKVTRTKADIERTVRRALETAIANGVTAMRSHVDVEATTDLQTVETILQVREAFRDQIDLQLVALGYATNPASQATMRSALALGVDLVGGAPALTPDPAAELDGLFALAEASGKGLDLHIDETEDPQMCCLASFAARAIAHGLQGQVTAGHCCSLAFVDAATAARVIEQVADARMHIVTLPSCNLVLMGRGQHPTPRGVTLVQRFLDADVNISAASDNVHDPFNPFGSYDLLQIANLNAHVAHLSGAAQIHESLRMVTQRPAAALGLHDYGIRAGTIADLVVLDTTSVLAAVTDVPARLATFKHGRLLVRTTIERQWA